jgi:TM2 domain-containing membrane protein YozV
MTLPDVYGDDPESEPEAREPEESRRSRGVALALCLVGGWCGLHRFYVGKTKTALAMMPTFGGLGVWWFYDLVLIAAGEFRDADDLPLRHWEVEQSQAYRGELRGRAERRVTELEEQLDGLRQQFNDLAERVDFAERMLAKGRSLESGVRSQSPQLPNPGS